MRSWDMRLSIIFIITYNIYISSRSAIIISALVEPELLALGPEVGAAVGGDGESFQILLVL